MCGLLVRLVISSLYGSVTLEKSLTLFRRLVFSSITVSPLYLQSQETAWHIAGIICWLNEWLCPKETELGNTSVPSNLGIYELSIYCPGFFNLKISLFAQAFVLCHKRNLKWQFSPADSYFLLNEEVPSLVWKDSNTRFASCPPSSGQVWIS